MLISLNANGLVNRDVGSISPVVRRLTGRLWDEPELAKRMTALKGVIEWACGLRSVAKNLSENETLE